MSEKGEEKEATRGMKHLLIHRLLQHRLRVFEPVAMKKGVDIAICDVVNEELKCISAQVRTCSLRPPREGSKQWFYEFSVAKRDAFINSQGFFHLLCLEEEDELKPTYLIIPNPILKKLIEDRLKAPTSWKRDKHYTRHLTRKQRHELGWMEYEDRFDLIDKALGIKKRKQIIKESAEYWKSDTYKKEKELYI